MNTNPELARRFPSDFLPSSVIAEYRRRLIVLTGLVALVMAASTAHANFVVFSVGGLHPGESALVAEQIFSNPNFGGLFDYEFLVFNTSLNLGPLNNFGAIDGFFVGVPGDGGLGIALAGGLRFASAPGGGDGPFPNVVPGGALDPPITDFFGATNPFSPVLFKFWGFEQFDNLPFAYVVRWYAFDGIPPMPRGFFTRFDLISPFGPVPGGGGVDPFGPTSLIGIDDGIGNVSQVDSPIVTVCSPDSATNPCTNTIPAEFASALAFGAPEPDSIYLLGIGLLALGLIRRVLAQ